LRLWSKPEHGGLAINACYEDGGTNFTDNDTVTPGAIDSAGKAGLGLASTPAVNWRLPTRNDFYQAELDGIRYVMPDTGGSQPVEWTSIIDSMDIGEAYRFNSATGATETVTRWNDAAVRCVGR